MADLDALLASAVAEGKLTALTLWPAGKGWQANAKNHLGGWNCVTGDDPVAALRAALTGPYKTPNVPPARTTDKGSVFD